MTTTMIWLDHDPDLALTEADILCDLPALSGWAPATARETRLAEEGLDELPAWAGFRS